MKDGTPGSEDMDRVLQFLPAMERRDFNPGSFAGGERLPDGSIQMPYFVAATEVYGLMGALSEHGFVYPFDWPAWQDEARRYVADEAALAEANLDTLRKLLTTHVRKDRFCDGHFAQMVRNGHLAAVLRRLRELRLETKG